MFKISHPVITLVLGLSNVGLVMADDNQETITVTASRPALSGASLDEIIVSGDEYFETATLSETLSSTPGIAFTGQGGLFQTVSMRGVSGWRVRSLFGDIPINTERRAGNALSFIDPSFTQSINIVKGPSSTRFGSGALGGVIQVLPVDELTKSMHLSYDVNSGFKRTSITWGGEKSLFAVSLHDGNRLKTPTGNHLNTGYEQTSFLINTQWQASPQRTYSFFLLPSFSQNIGKSNIDYPDKRVTSYPRDYHTLANATMNDSQWGYFSLFTHLQKWQTHVDRLDGRKSFTENAAKDSGLYWKKHWQQSDQVSWLYGIDYLQRNGVEADELNLDGLSTHSKNILSAQEKDIGFFVNGAYQNKQLSITAGLRGNYLEQTNKRTLESDFDRSSFLSTAWQISESWTIVGKVSQAFRFPSLTERFFNGTTGRGSLVGNQNLDTEKSINYELSAMRKSSNRSSSINVYWFNIDHFIERMVMEEGVYSFANVNKATIKGIEWKGSWHISDNIDTSLSLHTIKGEDMSGIALNDIPPFRVDWEMIQHFDKVNWGVRWQFIGEKENPGSGEVSRSEHHIMDLFFEFQPLESLTTQVQVKNLLDEEYFLTPDDKSTVAPQRAIMFVSKLEF